MKLLNYVNTFRKLKDDPFGFIVDSLVTVIVSLVIPLPLAGIAVSTFRAPILGLLASLVALMLFMMMVVGIIFMSPAVLSTAFLQNIVESLPFGQNTLNIPPDTSFTETSVPKQNPLGGSGMLFTTVTAYYMDADYYLRFGRNHEGIDLVPSDTYYQNSTTYQQVQKVAVFATINGTARHFVDSYGGESIEIVNSSNNMKVVYVHFSQVLVESGTVRAGTPIGIMGGTGFSTGDHVHYEVRIKDGNNWLPVNPLNHIQ